MASATAQQGSERGSHAHTHTRHRRHRNSLSRIRPATWRKIGVYALVYAIAIVGVWKLL